MNSYQTPEQRVGEMVGTILAHAQPVMALSISGAHEKMPRKKGTTVWHRRFLPPGATLGTASSIHQASVDPNAMLLQEGQTPLPDTLLTQDVQVTLNEYGVLTGYTNRNEEVGEDDIPAAELIYVGEKMGLLREMIAYGVLKACTNRFYAGGTSRATVDEPINLSLLRKVTQTILGNRGGMVNKMVRPGMAFETQGIEPSFVVFGHTSFENDIRNLPGFTSKREYASDDALHPAEIGAVERMRFVLSPELNPYLAAGASVTGTGMTSAGGSNVDVYPLIVVGAQAWADVALRGMESVAPHHVPLTASKSDPLGQRGYISARTWASAFIKADGWMATVEAGVTSL